MLILDTNTWAQQQFSDCQLGDERRTRRLVRLAEQVVSHPSGGFPEQTETWADLKAAYRLLDRAEVTFQSVGEVHWEQTRRRSAGRYLVLGDTTELDFGFHRDIPDLGPTGNGGGWGFLLHSGLLVAAEGEEIFGLAGQRIHYRKPAPHKENTTQRLERDRESKVWGEVIDAVGRPSEDVELVHVLDRGADNFEVYCHCLEQGTDWVVRVTQKNRNILTPDDRRMPLKAYLTTLPLSGTYELSLRARPGQAARTAKLQVRYGALLAHRHGRELGIGQSSTQAQRAPRVLILGHVGKPVVAAGLVVLGQVGAQRRAGLVASFAHNRTHVAALAAEVTSGAVGVVAAGARLQRGLVGNFERSPGDPKVGGQAAKVGNRRGGKQAGFVLAEGTLDDAVGIGRIVEGRLGGVG